MQRSARRAPFVVGVVLVWAGLSVGTAQASDVGASTISPTAVLVNASTVSVTASSRNGEYTSQSLVTFDSPLSKAQQQAVEAQLGSATQVPMADALASAPEAAPSGAIIHCDKYYSFVDGNGTFHIQRGCASTTAPWAFTIAPYWCSVAVSPVVEHGMSWTRNGVTQPRNSPHTQSCSYLYHGTFNPGRALDKLTYIDLYDFQVVIGGAHGNARLTISGNFTLASSPCSPTSC